MSPDTDDSLSQDLVFDLLSSQRRRMVLYYLRRHGGEGTITELADQIAALENDVEPAELTKQQQKRVYVSIYQTHIPKLADAGVVEYDRDSGEVALTRLAREIDRYLTPGSTESYPWELHYLGLTTLGAVVLLLSVAGVPPFAGLSGALLAALLVAAFVVSSVVQFVRSRANRERLPEELTEDAFP
ncbi:DUF7344 domain-containing protein [Halosegnis marinus]|uniref:DUF7344 domain-containing protein n=1 Tax=Halosegnis marinus TaxID=3034023 RepID=A0ABD5ZRN1_9EURY|nr:hypothetical protein [Halosegnis sp. DT85]